MADTFYTPKFTGAYAYLLKPRVDDKGENKYGVMAVFDKADQKVLEAELNKFVAREFPGKTLADIKKMGYRTPLKEDMYDKDPEKYAFTKNKITANLIWNQPFPPEVWDAARHENIISPGDAYSGARYMALVNFFVYNHAMNKGISIGLQSIAKVGEGERMGSAPPAAASVFGHMDIADNAAEFEDSEV
jgi:hypothetical protein